MKDYKKLNKYEDYDHDVVEELAEALNEVAELQKRLTFLGELIADNKELEPFIWQTKDGNFIAIHNIDSDHLENILGYLNNSMRTIPKSIKAEARKRGIEIPGDRKNAVIEAYSSSEAFNEDVLDIDDIPF